MYSGENFFVALDYETNLEQLRVSKIKDDLHRQELISNLTLLAHSEVSKCEVIVNVIRSHWQIISQSSRVLIISLLHSIVTSVGGDYTNLFNEYIVDMFVTTYEHAEPKAREELLKLRGRWDLHFSRKNLQTLDVAVKEINPLWPTFPPMPPKMSMEYENFDFTKNIVDLKKERDSLMAEIEHMQREKKRKRKTLESIDQDPQKKQRIHQVYEVELKPEPKPAAAPEHTKRLPEIEEKKPAAEKKSKSKSKVQSNKKPKSESKTQTEPKIATKPKNKSKLEQLRSKWHKKISKWTPNQSKSNPEQRSIGQKISIIPLPENKTTNGTLEKPLCEKENESKMKEKYLELFGNDNLDTPMTNKVPVSSKTSSTNEKSSGPQKSITQKSEKEAIKGSFEKPPHKEQKSRTASEIFLKTFTDVDLSETSDSEDED